MKPKLMKSVFSFVWRLCLVPVLAVVSCLSANGASSGFRNFEYYRVTISAYDHDTYGGRIELREIALFDEDGNQVNAGLKPAAGYAHEARRPFNDDRWYFYTVAVDPKPGEYAFSSLMSGQNFIIRGDSAASTVDDAMAKNFSVLFDGNVDSLGIHLHLWDQPITEKEPFSVVMHLADNSKPVKYFDICSAYSNFTGPLRVKLEGSIDNVSWTTVYSNIDAVSGWPTAPGRGVWYSDCGTAWQDGWSFAVGGAHEAEIIACLTARPKSGGFALSSSGTEVIYEKVFTLMRGERPEDWLNPASYLCGWGAGETAETLPTVGDRIIFEWNTAYLLDASNEELMAMLNRPVSLLFQPGSVIELFVPAGMTVSLDSRLWGYHDGVTPNCGKLVKKGAGTLILPHASGDWSCATPSEVPGLPRAYVAAHYNINLEVVEGAVKLPPKSDMIYVGGVTVKRGAEFHLLGNPSGAAKTIFNYLVVERGGTLVSVAADATFDILPWTLKHPGTMLELNGIVRADSGRLDLTAGCSDSFGDFEYYRFTVSGYHYQTEKRMYIREIALFDDSGKQVNKGLTIDEGSYQFVAHDGWADRYVTLATGLPAKGKFCFGVPGASYYSVQKDENGAFRPFDFTPNRFFDGSDTDANFYNHQCKPFEEVPLSIVMHLPAGAKSATCFDVASGWTAGDGIARATLEGSCDGVHWTVVYSNAAPDDEPWPINPGIGVWMSDLRSCIGAGNWVSKRFPLTATGGVKVSSVGELSAKAGACITSSYPVTACGCALVPGQNGAICNIRFSSSACWNFQTDDGELETRYFPPVFTAVSGANYLEANDWRVNSQPPDTSFELTSHLPDSFLLSHYFSGSMMIFR